MNMKSGQSPFLLLEFITALILYTLVYTGLGFLSFLPRNNDAGISLEMVPSLLVLTIILNLALFVGLTLITQFSFHRRLLRLTFRKHPFLNSLLSVAIGVIALIGIALLMGILSTQLIGREEIDPLIATLVEYFDTPFRLLFVVPLFMLLAAGIPEEVFRAYILSLPSRMNGTAFSTYALFISSLAFSLGHIYQGISAVMQIFPVGIFLGYYYLRRKSLWENIWLHTLYNTSAVILNSFGI